MDQNHDMNLDEMTADGALLAPQNDSMLHALTHQTPWWLVSIMLHALAITLAALVSYSIAMPAQEEAITITEVFQRPEIVMVEQPPKDPLSQLATKFDVPPTDINSPDRSEIVVSPELLAMAKLSDRFETVNPDRENTQSAFGTEESYSFHLTAGSDEPPGGGGDYGLEAMIATIGAGGMTEKGTGGGSGGGNGEGWGVQDGKGIGSFGNTRGGGRELLVKRYNKGSKATENSVQAALRWLAYNQEPDGRWDTLKHGAANKVDTAITGFALLAFLGAGNTEKVGQYADNVRRGVAWLKSKQQPNGLIFDTTDAGGHRGGGYPAAIATLAIVEAAGMANIPDTKTAAQKAINYCTDIHQAGEGSDKQGWRYAPKSEADTSVTGWFVMALKSAKVAGLKVDRAAFEGAIQYLDSVEIKEAGGNGYGTASRYKYQVNNEHAATAHRLTAIGTLCRQFLGWKKEELQASVDGFVAKGGVPTWGANGEKVDLYYWYYGSLCTFQQHGEVWEKWNEGMKKALTENQCKNGADAGSWNIVGDYSGEWGRVGQTALGALCLEVYYRYGLMGQ